MVSMEWLVVWICCGIGAAMVASSKGRSGCGWFMMGFLLGPFGLIFALLSGKEGPTEEERKCPFCAEFIKKEAIVCKHCGRDLPVENTIQVDGNNTSRWILEQPPLTPWKTVLVCPRCGAKNSEDHENCQICGWGPQKED